CEGTETCATSGDPTSFRYDAYTFTNTGSAACVTIDTNTACNADHAIFTSAYLGSFDPNNLCTNWVGDSGFPPDPDQAFHVEVPGGQTLVPFSSCGYADPVTLGSNLDAYQAAGGVVVAFNFDWFGGSQSIGGAWIANDSPYNDNATTNFSSGTLGTCTFGPLCNCVSTLDAFFREITTLASGATLAATWNDGSPLIAYKGRAVGVSAYVGDFAGMWSGDFAKVNLNSGTFLLPFGSPTATATATAPSATPTLTPTATAPAPSAPPTCT